MRTPISRGIATIALVLAAACSREAAAPPVPAPEPLKATGSAEPGPPSLAMLDVEGFGEIRIELLPQAAPATAANFEKLAQAGFYDGTTFHRVVPGFVIQGGDPNSRNRDPRDDGFGGPGYRIAAEFNDTPHLRGTVSMARGAQPDTAGSQFFIVLDDHHDLDGQYTAFGRVIEGIEVADRIVAVPRDQFGRHGPIDRPLENVVIRSVRIEPIAPSQSVDAGAGPSTPGQTRVGADATTGPAAADGVASARPEGAASAGAAALDESATATD